MSNIWKTASKEIIELDEIFKILEKASKTKDHKIIIGSDSVKSSGCFMFVKAICILDSDFYDRRYFYLRKKIIDDSYRDISKRLIKETTDSIELAFKIQNKISDVNIEIHADVNHNLLYKSSKYKHAITGYISGCGFDFKIKPNAFVASGLADLHTRKP